MSASADALLAAIEGRPLERPMLAPLFAALAADVEELELHAFLADAGARARILAGLARSLPIDVLVADSGSGWELNGGAPVVTDLLARLAAVVPAHVALAVTLTGPATRAARTGAPLESVLSQVLAAAREIAAAGARVVIVREDAAVADAAAYARLAAPLWGSLKFFRAAGVLQVAGPADAWAPALAVPGPFLPVVDAAAASTVGARAHGLALPPGVVAGAELLADGRCALLTHVRDLAGEVAVRDLPAAIAGMADRGS